MRDGNFKRAARRGFTLVELVMTVAIIAVIGAMAMPRAGSAANAGRAEAGARKLAADINLLRLGARASSAPTSLTITPATNSYRLTGVARAGGADPTVSLSGFPFSCTVSLQGGSNLPMTVTFSAGGVPSSGLAIYVSAGSVRKTVRIDPATGAATVQ